MKVKDKVAISEHRCKSLSDYNMFIAETCALIYEFMWIYER